MRVVYDKKRDTLTVLLKERARVAGSDEDKPGNVLDYDASGDLISLAILDALRRVTDARKVDFSRDERPDPRLVERVQRSAISPATRFSNRAALDASHPSAM
jgi:uncharacterized protein YuzE